MSQELQTLDYSRKNSRTSRSEDESKFYSDRGKERKRAGCEFLEIGSGVELPNAPWLPISQGTTVKEAQVYIHVDTREPTSELCVWLVSPWGFLCFEGYVVSELYDIEF